MVIRLSAPSESSESDVRPIPLSWLRRGWPRRAAPLILLPASLRLLLADELDAASSFRRRGLGVKSLLLPFPTQLLLSEELELEGSLASPLYLLKTW